MRSRERKEHLCLLVFCQAALHRRRRDRRRLRRLRRKKRKREGRARPAKTTVPTRVRTSELVRVLDAGIDQDRVVAKGRHLVDQGYRHHLLPGHGGGGSVVGIRRGGRQRCHAIAPGEGAARRCRGREMEIRHLAVTAEEGVGERDAATRIGVASGKQC